MTGKSVARTVKNQSADNVQQSHCSAAPTQCEQKMPGDCWVRAMWNGNPCYAFGKNVQAPYSYNEYPTESLSSFVAYRRLEVTRSWLINPWGFKPKVFCLGRKGDPWGRKTNRKPLQYILYTNGFPQFLVAEKSRKSVSSGIHMANHCLFLLRGVHARVHLRSYLSPYLDEGNNCQRGLLSFGAERFPRI